MRVFRKGSEVKRRLNELKHAIGDIPSYAKALAEQAQRKHFAQIYQTVEYIDGTFRVISSVPAPVSIHNQMHTLLDTVLDRVSDAEDVLSLANEWVPLIYDEDMVEVAHGDLIKLKLDPILPVG